MPRRSRERTHAVRATLKVQGLAKAGSSLHLDLYAHGEKIGTLEIGRGALYWKGGKRKRSKRLSWTRFAERMDELSYA
jgi:hypothetical protein